MTDTGTALCGQRRHLQEGYSNGDQAIQFEPINKKPINSAQRGNRLFHTGAYSSQLEEDRLAIDGIFCDRRGSINTVGSQHESSGQGPRRGENLSAHSGDGWHAATSSICKSILPAKMVTSVSIVRPGFHAHQRILSIPAPLIPTQPFQFTITLKFARRIPLPGGSNSKRSDEETLSGRNGIWIRQVGKIFCGGELSANHVLALTTLHAILNARSRLTASVIGTAACV